MLPFRLMTDCLVLIGVPEHLIQAALTYKPNHAAMEALLARCIKIRKNIRNISLKP